MITALVLVQSVALLILVGLFFAACKQNSHLRSELHDEFEFGWLTAFRVSHEAEVLRRAAQAWDSIEEQGNLKRLGWSKYKAGGPSMPVIWLNDRADKIERGEQEDTA